MCVHWIKVVGQKTPNIRYGPLSNFERAHAMFFLNTHRVIIWGRKYYKKENKVVKKKLESAGFEPMMTTNSVVLSNDCVPE